THEIPIGKPLSNTTAYVLDPQGQPVPVGVPGELYLGGVSLARGYLNQPALTAERFMPDPFSPISGSRLYRTGDLARWLADGTIEFWGRADTQVKLRGFRIELGEIEAVLRQHETVRDAVVLAREDTSPGDLRLVAYVVPHPESTPTPTELRSFLRASLPEYMVPSTFITLDQLPLTSSGKVNLRALPAPERGRSAQAATLTPPRTPTEQTVATLWQEVLKLEAVSIDDNFFELGGHSLLATQLIARLRTTFQVDLPLRHLFTSPTIAGVAQTIETIQWMAQSAAEPVAVADESLEEGEL
ncbi:MAG: non-ribosomal peptide synthetase, partial [Chloroflexi bacterium]|nr:non-ribosomal peptide synthetase [Chloroflexota bacterium]